jgi:hypothetical protein
MSDFEIIEQGLDRPAKQETLDALARLKERLNMDGEAYIFRRMVTQYPSRDNVYKYFFSLKGANGEIIAQSEAYNQKQSAVKTLTTYFPNFDIIDDTSESDES